MFVWRMSNHERMAASGIRGGGAERPSWAQSGHVDIAGFSQHRREGFKVRR
jgi:hypothetical protein